MGKMNWLAPSLLFPFSYPCSIRVSSVAELLRLDFAVQNRKNRANSGKFVKLLQAGWPVLMATNLQLDVQPVAAPLSARPSASSWAIGPDASLAILIFVSLILRL